MARPCTLALVQATPSTAADPVAELAAEVAAITAERPEADLVAYPELHLFGGADLADDARAWCDARAQPLEGPRVAALAEIARAHGIHLVPGSLVERAEDGRIFNTAIVLGRDGSLISSYRKVFPWRPYETWSAGHRFSAFELPGLGRFGVNVCYDSWFPEATRQIAWMGAEVVLNLVKTTTPDRAQELVLAQANAIVNQVFYLSVDAAGPRGRGDSIYVGPEGEVLARAEGPAPATTYLEIDLDRVTAVRESGTAGTNRMWEQLLPGDEAIELPAYDGRIRPGGWQPSADRCVDVGLAG